MSIVDEAHGTKTTDGTEQTLLEDTTPTVAVFELEVSFDNHVDGDAVRIRHYDKVLEGGSFEVVYAQTYVDYQGEVTIIRTPPIASLYGVKFTIEKLTGSNHGYDWRVTSYQKN